MCGQFYNLPQRIWTSVQHLSLSCTVLFSSCYSLSAKVRKEMGMYSDGFWLPGPSRWLTLTLVWGTVVLSSVHLFTRGFSLILDFCQMHLLSGQLLLISPLAPGIQFHTFSLSTRTKDNLMPACSLHHGAHSVARIHYHSSVLTRSRTVGPPQHSNCGWWLPICPWNHSTDFLLLSRFHG